MKILCIIGLIVILALIFLGAMPLIFAAMLAEFDVIEKPYTLGFISTIIVIIMIISIVIVNFYFTPEIFGYQKIVSENCIESED